MTDTDTITEPEAPEAEAETPAPEADADAPAKVDMTQAELDDMIAKRLARDRKKWEAESAQAAERAKLDEIGRLKAEKEDSDKAVAEARREALAVRVETTAERLALKAGVKPERVERFLRNVDIDLDEVAPDGKPDGDAIAKMIDATLADLPEFAGTPAPAGASSGEFNGAGAGKVWTRAEIAKLSPEQYEKHEAEILAQLQKPGGIK